MDIRQIIQDEMQRQGMTQKALQVMTGILQHRISEYLTGKRDMTGASLQKILKALGLEIRPQRRRRRKG